MVTTGDHPITFLETYRTPPEAHTSTKGLLPLSLRFYMRYTSLIKENSILAQKGLYVDKVWQENCLKLFRIIEAIGGEFEITGLNNIQKEEGPYVIMGNHMSTLETNILPAILGGFFPVSFVMKESILKIPFFGKVAKACHPISITRTNRANDLKEVYNRGTEALKEGRSVIIFPQGTRKGVFNRSDFNSLAIKLAMKAGVPCLPLAEKTDFWGNSKGLLKDMGPISPQKRIYFAFGEAVKPQKSGKEAQTKLLDFIESHLKEWGIPIEG